MPQLIIKSGESAGQTFHIEGEHIKIGRSLKNHIVLSDSTTSREHAEIYREGDTYYLRDLNSTHGTSLDGERISQPREINDGDLIHIGATSMIIEGIDPAPSPSASKDESGGDTDVDSASIVEDNPSESTIRYTMRSDSTVFENVSREQHSAVLAHLAEAMKAVFDIDELLPTLMDTLFDIFKPGRGVILLFDEQSGQMVPRCQRPEDEPIKISRTVMEKAIEEKVSLLLWDVASDEEFSAAESILSQSIASAICCPLLGKDQILGLIYIDSQLHRINYEKDDLALLNIIAVNAAIAIENANLMQEKMRAERLAAFGVAVAGISHFAKNVIAGIQGSSEIMNTAIQKEDITLAKKAWPILQRSNNKIRSLVQDMLAYAKPREPEWDEGDIGELLSEIYESQKDRADSEGVELKLHLCKSLQPSRYDKKMLHDALLNLTTNAIEACSDMDNVTVALSAEQRHGRINIAISDNGPGIPVEVRSRLFEPFFSTKGSKGTGLGLAVTKKAIEEHGGHIKLQTEVGKGTTFIIRLPVGPPDQTAH